MPVLQDHPSIARPNTKGLREPGGLGLPFLPPLSFHQNAQKEAEAQECVAEQGGSDAYFKFSGTIFDRTTSNGLGFALTALAPLATERGLNGAKLQACLDSG